MSVDGYSTSLVIVLKALAVAFWVFARLAPGLGDAVLAIAVGETPTAILAPASLALP
jgi:hypothetical protein